MQSSAHSLCMLSMPVQVLRPRRAQAAAGCMCGSGRTADACCACPSMCEVLHCLGCHRVQCLHMIVQMGTVTVQPGPHPRAAGAHQRWHQTCLHNMQPATLTPACMQCPARRSCCCQAYCLLLPWTSANVQMMETWAMLAAQCQVAQEILYVVQAAAAKDKSLVNCPQPGCQGLAAAGGELSSRNDVPLSFWHQMRHERSATPQLVATAVLGDLAACDNQLLPCVTQCDCRARCRVQSGNYYCQLPEEHCSTCCCR